MSLVFKPYDIPRILKMDKGLTSPIQRSQWRELRWKSRAP